MQKPKPPLLQRRHFDHRGSALSLSDQGLIFDELIGPADRRVELFDQEHLSHLIYGPSTRIVLNPPMPSAKDLRAQLKHAQAKALPDERFNVGYQLPDVYDRSWVRSGSGDEDIEGQEHVALVAFSNDVAVGYAGLTVHIVHPGPREKDLSLSLSVHMVYVHPLYRKKGFGLDLSIGCSYLCRDILRALYTAVPAHTSINVYLNADYDSHGGERFAQHVFSTLEDQANVLPTIHKRRSVSIDVALDAGW